MPPDTTAVAASWKRESFVARDSKADIIEPQAGTKGNGARKEVACRYDPGRL